MTETKINTNNNEMQNNINHAEIKNIKRDVAGRGFYYNLFFNNYSLEDMFVYAERHLQARDFKKEEYLDDWSDLVESEAEESLQPIVDSTKPYYEVIKGAISRERQVYHNTDDALDSFVKCLINLKDSKKNIIARYEELNKYKNSEKDFDFYVNYSIHRIKEKGESSLTGSSLYEEYKSKFDFAKKLLNSKTIKEADNVCEVYKTNDSFSLILDEYKERLLRKYTSNLEEQSSVIGASSNFIKFFNLIEETYNLGSDQSIDSKIVYSIDASRIVDKCCEKYTEASVNYLEQLKKIILEAYEYGYDNGENLIRKSSRYSDSISYFIDSIYRNEVKDFEHKYRKTFNDLNVAKDFKNLAIDILEIGAIDAFYKIEKRDEKSIFSNAVYKNNNTSTSKKEVKLNFHSLKEMGTFGNVQLKGLEFFYDRNGDIRIDNRNTPKALVGVSPIGELELINYSVIAPSKSINGGVKYMECGYNHPHKIHLLKGENGVYVYVIPTSKENSLKNLEKKLNKDTIKLNDAIYNDKPHSPISPINIKSILFFNHKLESNNNRMMQQNVDQGHSYFRDQEFNVIKNIDEAYKERNNLEAKYEDKRKQPKEARRFLTPSKSPVYSRSPKRLPFFGNDISKSSSSSGSDSSNNLSKSPVPSRSPIGVKRPSFVNNSPNKKFKSE